MYITDIVLRAPAIPFRT